MEEQSNIKYFDEKYKTIFESVNAAVFLIEIDGKILEANQKSCELYLHDWDSLINNNISNIFPESAGWFELREEILSKGGMNFESINIQKDGTQFPVSISISLFKLEGKPVMLALIWDITERKKAEKKLKESEEKYEGLFEYTTDGMIVLDARGEIQDVNNRALELLGLSEEQMIGNNFLSMGFLTPKSLSIFVNQFQELLSKRIATSNETEITNSNGHIIAVELSSFFLVKKENEIDNFVLVIRDITERKQTEIKLAREHGLLQTLMDSTPDLIYFKDGENKFVMVNKAKAARSNVKPEDMIGKTDFDFLPDEEARKVFEDDEEVMKTGKFIINKVERLTSVDGNEKWVSVTKLPRFDNDGNIIGSMGISRDITELKKLEAMQQ